MTDNEKAAINARLAKAMEIVYCSQWKVLQHTIVGPIFAKQSCGHKDCTPAQGPLDFLADAAASRELVGWLAGQRRDSGVGAQQWLAFCKALLPTTKYLPTVWDIVGEVLTAPLETIALAADAALEGKDGK